MSASKYSCYRAPKTTAERRATATFIASEDGRTIAVRGSRKPNAMPHAWDDRQISSKALIGQLWGGDGRKQNYDTPDKVSRLEARRLARKFKVAVAEELARGVRMEIEQDAEFCY